MKQISAREFQRNGHKYLLDLPLELTIHKVVVARVVTPSISTKSDSKEITIVPKNIEISQEDIASISTQYKVPIAFVQFELESLKNYCASSGKKYQDYKAALRNFVLRDMKKQIERRFNSDPTKQATDARSIQLEKK
jgi:hypothetical protein